MKLMYHSLYVLSVAFVLFSSAGCKKDDDNTTAPSRTDAAPFFSAGRGFRYLTTISANDGSTQYLSFSSCDLSVTDDGKIHWCVDRSYTFGDGRIVGRFVLDPASGDTLPVTGKRPDKMVENYQWGKNAYDRNHGDRFLYKPYSSELYLSWQSNNYVFSAAGDVPKFDYLDAHLTSIRGSMLTATSRCRFSSSLPSVPRTRTAG